MLFLFTENLKIYYQQIWNLNMFITRWKIKQCTVSEKIIVDTIDINTGKYKSVHPEGKSRAGYLT